MEIFYESGRKMGSAMFQNAFPIGVFTIWHESGKMKFRCNYNKEGEMDGLAEDWDEEGRIYIIEKYKQGRKHGICERYNECGKLFSREKFENGVKIDF